MRTWIVTGKLKMPGAKDFTEFSFRTRGDNQDEAFIRADDVIKYRYSSEAVVDKDSIKFIDAAVEGQKV